MKERNSGGWVISWKVAWYGLLISLPITSFPFVSRLLAGSQVAPLALIPLAWLALTWLPTYLLKKNTRLPAESRPLLGFILVALLSSLLVYFYDTPPYKLHSVPINELGALLSLGIGICFYLVSITRLQAAGINGSLKAISFGGIILLAWSLAQTVVIWLFDYQYPAWMVTIHSWFSTTSLLRLFPLARVTGLAYEPSWLAHMLVLLYLPLWMAACWNRQSAFRIRIWKLMVEDFLLACGVLVLFLAFPRISLLSFALALGWFLLMVVKTFAGRIGPRKATKDSPARNWVRILLSLLILVVLIIGFMGLVFGMAFIDERLVPIFQLSEHVRSGELFQAGFMKLASRLHFAERVVFWEMGWRVFEQHPLLGVGLGNTGQFALGEVSHWAWNFMETRRILFFESFLPNTKNLWTRLLAETGLVGMAFFLVWMGVLWLSTRNLRNRSNRLDRTIGLAGQLALLSLVLEGFSVDSFALPFLWILPGILTAAGFLSRGSESSRHEKEA